MKRLVDLLRALGARETVRRIRARLWSSSRSFGLRCDLGALPERRAAKIPLRMVTADSASDAGLTTELQASEGDDYAEVTQRISLCDAGVRQLYVARDEAGAPAYVQWLISVADYPVVDRHSPGLYRPLGAGDVLLEGAYTYIAFRRLGAMADGMHQLLEIARSRGDEAAFTYVDADYPPSIRGCANVGFVLDHVAVTKRRLFARRIVFVPADDAARSAWGAATAPR